MKALILTAGIGSRFRPQSLKVPKPIMPFWGIPLFAYSYELLQILGVKDFIFNLHHLPHETKRGILQQSDPSTSIHFSDETTAILGSAGAIKKAEKIIQTNSDLFLCNGDEVFFPDIDDLKSAISQHQKEARLATIVTCQHPDAGKKFGAVWVDEQDKVKGFGREPLPNTRPLHYIGFMILNSRILSKIPLKETNILYDTLLPLLSHENVVAHTIKCRWFETGNEADYISAHLQVHKDIKALAANQFFSHMLKKYLNGRPEDFATSPLVYVNQHAQISSGVKLDGFVWLQAGVSVGANAHLHNVVVHENTQIGSGSVIQNQFVV